MIRVRSAVMVIVPTVALLMILAPLPVSADHGYWPSDGVDPATVSGHRARSAENTRPSFWGSDCEAFNVNRGLDVYGHVLEADYRRAVVLAQSEGEPLRGRFGITIFTAPRAGEFLWADADGDGRFRKRHEADAGAIILCPGSGLPETDTAVAIKPSGIGVGHVAAWLAAITLAVLGLLRRLNRHERRPSGGR